MLVRQPGGTTEHITNPVLLHTVLSERWEVQLNTLLTLYCCTLCCQTGGTTAQTLTLYFCALFRQAIYLPLFEVITYPFPHISLAITIGDLFIHYIFLYPYLYGLLDFSVTYPHSLALRGTLSLYKCVWLASHYTCIALGENAEYQLNRRLDEPEIRPGSPKEVKNLLTLPGTYPQLFIHLSRPQPANHTNCTITATLLKSVLS